MLTGRAQIAIKQEANAGTAETLAAADVILQRGMSEYTAEIEEIPREAMTSSLSDSGSVFGLRPARIKFSMFLRGSYNHSTGASAAVVAGSTEADWHVPMLGCGAASTVSGGAGSEQNSYKPSSTTISDETTGACCTVGFYLDGKRYMIHGAQGNCVLTFTVGQPVLAEFDFLGVYNEPTDTALLSAVYPTVIEPSFLGASLSIPTSMTTAKVRSMKLDLGNTITLRPNPNSTTGLFAAQITRRRPVGSLDPEEVLAATENFWNHWTSGTTGALDSGVFPSNGSNNNQLQLTIPKAQYIKAGLADREGLATVPLDFLCVRNSAGGNDEWELIQT